MTRYVRIAAIVTLLAVSSAFAGQEKPQPAQEESNAATQATPVQVQVVISRYRDDKKVGSFPYLLSASVDQRPARLQVGGNVPVPSSDGKGIQYRNVGTSIELRVRLADGGRYIVDVNVSESAVAGGGQALSVVPGVAPVLKTYTSNSMLALRNGQTAQFTAATDPISGETVRVDVTLNVQK